MNIYNITEPGGQSVAVTHKRAPTDESVRLLREMEQAARDQVTHSIRLSDSPIDCVVHSTENPLNDKINYAVHLRVNGKQLEARCSFNHGCRAADIADGLLSAVSNRIAAELLRPAFRDLARRLEGTTK